MKTKYDYNKMVKVLWEDVDRTYREGDIDRQDVYMQIVNMINDKIARKEYLKYKKREERARKRGIKNG